MSATESPERLFTGYSGRISNVLAIGWTGSLLGRQAISPLLPAIIDTLSITPSQAGFALTLMIGLYSVVQYPGGRFSDDLSRTTILLASLAIMIAGFGLLTLTPTYAVFLVGVAAVGTGNGAFFSPSRVFLSDLFVERRGHVLGVHLTAGQLGGVLAAGSAAVVLSVTRWQFVFVPAILLLGVVLVLLHRWSREPYVLAPVRLDLLATARRVSGTSGIRGLFVASVLVSFAITAFSGFLPTFLQVEKGVSPVLASGGFALIYVVGMGVGPVAGYLSDRFRRETVPIVSLLVGAIGLLALLLGHSRPVLALGIVGTAIGFWGFLPPITAAFMDLLPDDSLGADFGLLKAVFSGLGSLGPVYVGIVAEWASYATAFGTLLGCLVGSALVIVATARS